MYLMYVDESGDPGTTGSPTPNFILSAIVLHEAYWLQFLNDAISFRRDLKITKGLMMKEEIHSSEFISKRVKLKNPVSRNNRLDILKKCIIWLSKKDYLSVITVKVDKSKHNDPYEAAWRYLLQRFENTLNHQNFPNPAFNKDLGIIISDNTDTAKLTKLVREMRRFNFVPSMFPGMPTRKMPLNYIIKDPIFRESYSSYLIQFADVVAYFAFQYFKPNKYMRQKGAKDFYKHLSPIINQNVTQNTTHYRILTL